MLFEDWFRQKLFNSHCCINQCTQSGLFSFSDVDTLLAHVKFGLDQQTLVWRHWNSCPCCLTKLVWPKTKIVPSWSDHSWNDWKPIFILICWFLIYCCNIYWQRPWLKLHATTGLARKCASNATLVGYQFHLYFMKTAKIKTYICRWHYWWLKKTDCRSDGNSLGEDCP